MKRPTAEASYAIRINGFAPTRREVPPERLMGRVRPSAKGTARRVVSATGAGIVPATEAVTRIPSHLTLGKARRVDLE